MPAQNAGIVPLVGNIAPLEGFETTIRYIRTSSIAHAVAAIIARLLVTSPEKTRFPGHKERNQRIRELYASGMTQTAIAPLFGITSERVSQIVNEKDE